MIYYQYVLHARSLPTVRSNRIDAFRNIALNIAIRFRMLTKSTVLYVPSSIAVYFFIKIHITYVLIRIYCYTCSGGDIRINCVQYVFRSYLTLLGRTLVVSAAIKKKYSPPPPPFSSSTCWFVLSRSMAHFRIKRKTIYFILLLSFDIRSHHVQSYTKIRI